MDKHFSRIFYLFANVLRKFIINQSIYMIVFFFLISVGACFHTQPILNTYDLQLSKIYVAYGILSYCPKKCLESWNCKFSQNYPKLINVTHINNDITLAAAYIGYEPVSKAVIISWRGSANAQNWIQDFTIEMQPFSGCSRCYIHVGFHQDYHLNQKKLFQRLDLLTKSYPVSKIIITGHSLGAALASINALYIAMTGINFPIEVYNFGSPRFGNENLARFTKLKVPNHFRLVHNRDLIPHLPPSVEYKHAANEIFFNQNMTSYKICNDSGQDPQCSNKFFPEYSAGDHNFYFVNIGDTKC